MFKKIIQNLLLSISVMLIIYIVLHPNEIRKDSAGKTVYLNKSDSGVELIKNGKPFYMKGASGNGFVKELSQAGGNTLRVYDTTNLKAILDEAAKTNVSVIVDIPIRRYSVFSNFYESKNDVESLKNQITELVNRYKSHSALLIWNLGNEVTYPLVLKKNGFIDTFNELIDLIHLLDPDHPISTSVSGTSRAQTLSIHMHSPKLDMIAFNTFSNIDEVQSLMNYVSIITNPKPYYLTEWGIDGPWEGKRTQWYALKELTGLEKAKHCVRTYKKFISSNQDCLGSLAFYWGNKVEGTPTWFNIFDQDGRKSHMYYALKYLWTGKESNFMDLPYINSLQLNNVANNNVVFPDATLTFDLELVNLTIDSVAIRWELYKEGWGNKNWEMATEQSNLDSLNNLQKINHISINAPKTKGPYRLFVNVKDTINNFYTSSNIPFFILPKESY